VGTRRQKKKLFVIWRIRFVQTLFSIFLLAVLGKVFYLQTTLSTDLKQQANSQKHFVTPTRLFRGEIVDSQGIILAVDTARFEVYLRGSTYKASPKQQEKLSQILNISPNKISKAKKSQHLTRLASFANLAQVRQIKQLRIKGIELAPKNQRIYPQGELAAHILGFVGWDSNGKTGIEKIVNQHFNHAHKKNKRIPLKGDGTPAHHLAPYRDIMESSIGQRIQLTINSKLQHQIERTLNEALKKFSAQKATALVLNPESGEILAWANSPSFDPNFYGKYPIGDLLNWSVSQIYEPGSTFKILTVASALQLKAIDAEDFLYLDQGKLLVNGRTIKNHDYQANYEREIDLIDVFRYSSNTAAAYIGLQMKPKDFYRQLKKFGLAQKTSIELPAESSGLLKDYKEWSLLDIATTSFGQGGIAVTPLQLAAAVGAIANDGVWVQPHLIKYIRSANESKILRKTKAKKKRVISKKVAQQVTAALITSINRQAERRPGVGGDLSDYSVAGKTGTAQIYCPKLKTYCPNQTIASFIGYFAHKGSKFLILVVFDSPEAAGGWGATVAGPVFNDIAKLVTSACLQDK